MLEHINEKIFIIAEAGVNHNGSLELALDLIDSAAAAGADAVKFQTFKAENLVTRKAEKAEYQKQNTKSNGSQFEMLKKLELTWDDHVMLKKHCQSKGVKFLSTPFDFESVDLLEELGVEAYKVSSGDLTNKPFLGYIASKNKPIILSTGMSTIEEVSKAVSWLQAGFKNKLILLHCTTNYPTAFEEVNLKAMDTLRETFQITVGYSDHTEGIIVPIAAAARGARIIEKHFTLDRKMEGPDHKASLEPSELKTMVDAIRNIEKALGDGDKKMTASESRIVNVARKGLVAKRAISKGKVIEVEDIAIKRPAEGIEPMNYDIIIGKTANKDIHEDHPIFWDDLQ